MEVWQEGGLHASLSDCFLIGVCVNDLGRGVIR